MSDNNIESINNEDVYDPDIISLSDEDGKEYKFEVLDRIEYNDGRYLALLPVFDNPEDLIEDRGELVVLKVLEDNGEEVFEEIQDDEEYEDVAGIFIDRLQDLFEIEEE